MLMDDTIKKVLADGGIECHQVVEVDAVESDYLITSAKVAKNIPAANQTLKNAHGGYAGKSIIERLQDLADSDFKRYMKVNETEVMKHLDSRVEGICECLAVMKNTSRGVEYESVVDRYQREIVHGPSL